ncbi:MAG: hypothetical protein ACUZ8A_03920, partial [Candidatus Bathyanammoxibius sp.]
MKLLRILHAAFFLFCLTALTQDVRAEQAEQAEKETAGKPPIDIGTFLQETFKLKVGGNMSALAAWLPFEFYVESAFAEGGQSRELLSKDFQFIQPYLTIIVQSSVDQMDGTASYESEEAIRARAVVRQKDGAEVKPLDAKDIPPMVSATMIAMKSILSAEGDPSGANMHVLVFPNKGKDGKPIINATKKGKLVLVLKP